jgi:hypothetical protein
VLHRHFDPAPYQVLQELQLRSARGEDVDAEVALSPTAAKPTRSRMDLASRLRLRKERQRQGHTMYSGFVPPYNTQSRVFDANELRRAATQVRVLGGGPEIVLLQCWCKPADQTKARCAHGWMVGDTSKRVWRGSLMQEQDIAAWTRWHALQLVALEDRLACMHHVQRFCWACSQQQLVQVH